jgi:hypothetical protein
MRTAALPFVLAFVATVAGCATQSSAPSFRFAASKAAAEVERRIAAHGDEVVATIWIGDAERAVWTREPDRTMPVASAIKTAFLIELFAANAGALDATRPEFATMVKNARHPAFSHFAPALREEIERDLATATVTEVGRAMIRGTGVSNGVYNAAANLTTALFGGPAGLTAKIHARDPAFAPMQVRRYMLAPRDKGDNEATAAALAAPLQRIVGGRLRGVDEMTLAAIRAVMRGKDHPRFGVHYEKGGSLDSDPLTRVVSGAFAPAGKPIVYVVMLRQAGPGERDRKAAGQRLGQLAAALRDAVLEAVDV